MGKRALWLVFCVCLSFALTISPVVAAPADPFYGASAHFAAPPDPAMDFNAGDWGVADQHGAATYTFPIELPPGRRDMAPALTLRYSSQSPLRGGLAAGWTLDVPSIRIDTSLGYEDGETRYWASLGERNGRLVEVPDANPYAGKGGITRAYRILFDATFARFFYVEAGNAEGTYWVALTADGVRHRFEAQPGSGDPPARWTLTSQVDPYGNTIRYHWSAVYAPNRTGIIDYNLQRIEYTANDDAHLAPHARVEFVYAPLQVCSKSNVPVGAAPLPGAPGTVEGAGRLARIQVFVTDEQGGEERLAREIALTYELSAAQQHYPVPLPDPPPPDLFCTQAPLRLLTQIDETAYSPAGVPTQRPPITFTYNRRAAGYLLPPQIDAGETGYGHSGDSLYGAKATLMDLDSDGLMDRVAVAVEDGVCKLLWHKGTVGGGFGSNTRRNALPTVPWYNQIIGNGSELLGGETCNLNGQVAYRPSHVIVDGHPGTLAQRGVVSYNFLDYNGDGRLDLLTSVWAAVAHSTYVPLATMAPPYPGASDTQALTPETRPGTYRYVWRLHTDLLHTSKIAPGALILAPRALPPTASAEHLGSSSAAIPILFDLDGDGFQDIIDTTPDRAQAAVAGAGPSGAEAPLLPPTIEPPLPTLTPTPILTPAPTPTPAPAPAEWRVFFGNGQTALDGDSFGPPVTWPVPQLTPYLNGSSTEKDGQITHYVTAQVVGLDDFNGDGLPDLLVQQAAGRMLTAYLNDGHSFATTPMTLGDRNPLSIVQADIRSTTSQPVVLDGFRGYRLRLVDLDSDGWRDVVRFSGSEDDIVGDVTVFARYNLGDRFGPLVQLPAAWGRGLRLFTSVRDPGGRVLANWHVGDDLYDVNGDGLLDLATWTEDRHLRYYASPGLPRAVDLLRSVDNGRGLTLRFEYGLSTDPEIVTINSSLTSPHYLPRPTWLVTTAEADAGFDTPTLRTEYHYNNPVYTSDEALTGEHQRQGFAGFATTAITTLAAAGQKAREVVRTYAYDESGGPSGELVGEATYHWVDGQRTAHKFTQKTWQQETLFGGEVPFSYLVEEVTRTCARAGSESDCQAQTAPVHRTTYVWTPLVPSGWSSPQPEAGAAASPELFVHTATLETDDFDSHYRTTFGYLVRYGQGDLPGLDYRVQLQEQRVEEQIDPSTWQLRDWNVTDFDVATGLPLRTHQYLDESNRATTALAYDAATGVLLATTRPEQGKSGGSGNRTVFTYDSHQLFIVKTTNELGHEISASYDVATGAIVQRLGPNFILEADGRRRYQQEAWDVDGFGRVLSHAVSLAADDAYALHTLSRTQYDDFAQPNLVRQEKRLNLEEGIWVTTEKRLDGMGRLLSTTQPIDAEGAAVTTYTYNGLGQVAAIDVPDPRADGASVRYAYSYDGLGRMVRAERPDGTGVAYSHDGLQVEVRELAMDGSGARRTEEYDVFGRLVEVVEFGEADARLVTRYHYDANGNLSAVEDAEGHRTELEHDLAGRRTSIARAQRTWRYTYDANGNLTREIAPAPAGADPADHTITMAYDDLDRLVAVTYHQVRGASGQAAVQVFLPLVSALSATNQQAVAAGPGGSGAALDTITYTYDQGVNGIGRLSEVRLPVGQIRYEYDARGLTTAEERHVTLAGPATLDVKQRVERRYNLLGLLTDSRWEDGQQWRITYDSRGQAKTVAWLDPRTGDFQTVADYERSLAGLPLTRSSNYGGVRHIGYDTLGRVHSDQITYAGNVLAERQYTFDAGGDLVAVSGHTRQQAAAATYTYDRHHRLVGASGPAGYAASFAYSPTGNILTASVSADTENGAQDVRYAYSQQDPQAVERLENAADGSAYASFAYDGAGNMIRRQAPDGTYALFWDGLDQLQRVEGPHGRESYFYDHNYQRMLAVAEPGEIRFWFDERETHFTLAGEQTKEYLHLAATGSTVARVEDGQSVELQYADGLHNLLLAHDEQGEIVSSFLYGPFGELLASIDAGDHRRQFNGKEHDQASGLHYYGYRYYDPLIRRWNSADPVFRFAPDLAKGTPQRQNLYAFSLNNPVRFYDPDGRAADDQTNEGDKLVCEEEVLECTSDARLPADRDEPKSTQAESDESNPVQSSVEGPSATLLQGSRGINGKGKKSADTSGPSISVVEVQSGISIGTEYVGENGTSASVEVTAAKIEGGVSIDRNGDVTAEFGVEVGTVGGCVEQCVPNDTLEVEFCVEVCGRVGFSAGASAKVGPGGVKAEAGVGVVKVGGGVKVRPYAEIFTPEVLNTLRPARGSPE